MPHLFSRASVSSEQLKMNWFREIWTCVNYFLTATVIRRGKNNGLAEVHTQPDNAAAIRAGGEKKKERRKEKQGEKKGGRKRKGQLFSWPFSHHRSDALRDLHADAIT
jgi:hypothetical protein